MIRIIIFSMFMFFSAVAPCAVSAGAGGEWPGVDETVVEKFAEEHGRPASCSIFSIEGDSLLFAFLVAGVVGGFVMGYYFRELTGSKGVDRSDEG